MPALARICERAPSAATRRRVAVTLPSANSTSRYCEEPDGDSHPPLEGRAIAYENRKANKTESSLEQIAEKRLRFPVRSCTCDSPALQGRVKRLRPRDAMVTSASRYVAIIATTEL